VILQALAEYYDRKAAREAEALPPSGWERKGLPFLIEIREDGSFVQVVDTRQSVDGRVRPTEFLVPQGPKRAVNIAASLLWDNVEYVLGIAVKNAPQRVETAHQAFIKEVETRLAGASDDAGVAAVLRFLAEPPLTEVKASDNWRALEEGNPFIGFRLAGDVLPVTQRQAVVAALAAQTSAIDGRCLVTGRPATIARLHTAIKGVRGAQSMGGSLVSFNLAAFESYGHSQGHNAPVGTDAMFRYTTALNALLRPDSAQKQALGDTTFVFWAESDAGQAYERATSLLFSDPDRDDPDRNASTVRDVLASVRNGTRAGEPDAGRFYVLGLAPNAARLSIRLWIVDRAAEIGRRIATHYDDIDIVRPAHARPYPSIYWLLCSVAPQRKAANVPPVLEGELVRAVLEGHAYPASLLAAAITRNRAEQDVSPDRASLIKASLNRTRRAAGRIGEDLSVALDLANPDPAYRLGRLFAVLERAQERASPGLNTTIRERYYGAASSTPIAVFPRLLNLKNHHIAKIESTGIRTWLERLIGEIVDGIPTIPAHLSLEQQGAFAIGYYHQRQDFYTKRATNSGEES
jgi:CRISPR-associated protein Csd1